MVDMGNTCCKRRKKLKKKIILLMVGLDNAGKTVAAKGLAGEHIDVAIPTVGFSVTDLHYLGHKIKLFDLGGGSDIRGIWSRYFVDAHGVIFVVDSSDFLRLNEVKEVLEDLLSHEKISGKPVLLLANKQDNDGALDEIDLVENLGLECLVNQVQCPTLVESCAAIENDKKNKLDSGIRKGFDWLVSYIIRHYDVLNRRVETDVRQQEIIERQARLEKIERLKKETEEKSEVNDADAIESYSEYNRKINGDVRKSEDKKEVMRNSNGSSTISDKSSSDSFPPIYFARSDDQSIIERPKSAVQMVKEQLGHGHRSTKTAFPKLRLNKTAPVNLYGIKLPRSADAKRKEFVQSKRNLKSAGDSAFFVTHLSSSNVPGPSGDDMHKQLFELHHCDKNLKQVKLQTSKKNDENGMPSVNEPFVSDKSGISVIDVE